MFDNLLESAARREHGASGPAFSIVLHSVMIACAVLATHRVVAATEPTQPEVLHFIAPPVNVPPPEQAPPPPNAALPPLPKGFQLPTAPIDIPDGLPPIDLSRPVTDEANYTGKEGVLGGVHDGVPGGVPRANADATYLSFEVEKMVAQMAGTGTPEYPEGLRNAGVDGSVSVSFVVDTTGRADMSTLKILKSTHALFTAAVKKALPAMRFFPAEAGGKKVRQLVLMPFEFKIKP
jgi:protein TonB